MELIYRDEAIKAINDVLTEDVRHRVWLKSRINNLKPVDAIPIEWIEMRIAEIGNDAPIVVGAFKGLIEVWKEEQEKKE